MESIGTAIYVDFGFIKRLIEMKIFVVEVLIKHYFHDYI